MRYDISKQTAPTMPTLSKGTECIKILLSQASKSIQEPLVPMFFPVLGAHISGAEFQYPDSSWKELTGIMCICNLSEATLADSREPHVQTPEAKRSYFSVVFLYKYFGFSLTYSYLCSRYADFRQNDQYHPGSAGSGFARSLYRQRDGGIKVKTMIQTIRVGRKSLSFAVTDPTNTTQPITYEPYVVKSGISMAANLREAFKTSELFQTKKVQVMVDSKVLLVPVERFEESEVEALYRHSFPKSEMDSIEYNVQPDANAVALFSINKDLKMVLTDRFEEVKLIHLMSPVWRYLHQRSFTGHRNKLFGYFHDQQLEIFSFQQHRFKFCNSFDTTEMHDALYFLLYVWKQLNLQPEHDEMHLVGDIPEQGVMLEELHNYLKNAYVVNPAIEFNKAPATQIKGMPFDLMTLLTKGR